MALTITQLDDLRADLGVDSTVFTDAELNRLWERTSGAANTAIRYEATLGLAARQLMMSATRLHDYTAGQTSEKLSQVFDHLRKIYELYRPSIEAATGSNRQVAIASYRPVPRQDRDLPADHHDRDDGLFGAL
jgi:hypothetical protein